MGGPATPRRASFASSWSASRSACAPWAECAARCIACCTLTSASASAVLNARRGRNGSRPAGSSCSPIGPERTSLKARHNREPGRRSARGTRTKALSAPAMVPRRPSVDLDSTRPSKRPRHARRGARICASHPARIRCCPRSVRRSCASSGDDAFQGQRLCLRGKTNREWE